MTVRAVWSLLSVGLLLSVAACTSTSAPAAFVRLDQVGYTPGESKIGFLLAPRDAADATVTVVDAYGKKVLTVPVGARRGSWNKALPEVRALDLSALRKPGVYRVRVGGPVRAESPPFHIATAAQLFGPLAADTVEYFQTHRDGADQLAGPWRRQPAHLADGAARVYDTPAFDGGGSLAGKLKQVDGPVDVAGGWYDAGDFLKLTHTTAYAVTAMLIAQRDEVAVAGLSVETRHGLDWLGRMWDPGSETLYTQVGIGSGGAGVLGDHDSWRLPQADDRLDVQPGDEHYFQRYRPVFRAGEPGEPISPNLAGRVTAAFALAAQVDTDAQRARTLLDTAAQIFARARTQDVGELVTAEPRSFYPEDSWTDDLALGATELARAGIRLGDSRTQQWLRQAAHWAKSTDGDDILSVYNVSALADAELARVLQTTPAAGTEIDAAGLRADLQRRLDAGVRAAAADPMAAAAGVGGSDYAARQLGYVATAELYEHTFHDQRYAAFATAQRSVVLGANGWGTSLIVGAGSTYPRCPHDQIASLTAHAASGGGMLGAVVNGPNKAGRVHELLAGAGPSRCTGAAFAAFDRDDAHYVDDTRISATTEPSIDFTATGLLAFALTARQH